MLPPVRDNEAKAIQFLDCMAFVRIRNKGCNFVNSMI